MIDTIATYAAWVLGWICVIALVACGAVQTGLTAAWEKSARVVIGAAIIGCAGVLADSLRTEPPGAALLLLAVALTAVSVWLVWVPHQHPALERITTGFGSLGDIAGPPSQ